MKISGRWSNPEVARLAAAALIRHNHNATAAVRELRPHLMPQSARKTASRMLHHPLVQSELAKLLNPEGEPERSGAAFVDILWENLNRLHDACAAGETPSRAVVRSGLQAAVLLGRLYIKPGMADQRVPDDGTEEMDPDLRRMLGRDEEG